jgi:hypothetical protein
MSMTRTVRTLAALTTALLLLSGCGGAEGPTAPDAGGSTSQDAEMVEVSTDIATLSRPAAWEPLDAPLEQDRVAAFSIEEAGSTVGQMDVLVNEVPAGTGADAVDAANQGARAAHFQELRHERREFTEVPGAESAFLNESTYVTADGESARSVDLVAVTTDGDYLLVRISTAETAFDRELVDEVLGSVRLRADTTS